MNNELYVFYKKMACISDCSLFFFTLRFTPEMITKQRHMLTTNKAESVHRQTLRMVPKNKLMRRTYTARCLSVVLFDTLGIKKTAEKTATALGYTFSSEAERQLDKLQYRAQYRAQLKRNPKNTRARYLARQARLYKRQVFKLKVTEKGLRYIKN